jgi:hypothetical protein
MDGDMLALTQYTRKCICNNTIIFSSLLDDCSDSQDGGGAGGNYRAPPGAFNEEHGTKSAPACSHITLVKSQPK